MSAPSHVAVAAFVPLKGTFTYVVPESSRALVQPGCRVVVPFGRRQVVGVVIAPTEPGDLSEIKPLSEVLDEEPVFSAEVLELLQWMATYYRAPLGEVLRAALPKALQAQEQQRVRLTDEGRRVLAAQQAVLRSADEDLAPAERALLERLQQKGGLLPPGRGRARSGQEALLKRLLERGLITRRLSRPAEARLRTELLLELCEPLDQAAIGRAPRQRALVEALRLAGGRARLSELPDVGREGRAVAQRLAQKGVVQLSELEVPHDPFAAEPVEVDRQVVLNADQRGALQALVQALDRGGFWPALLHGVTSSGKTEVYLRLIAEVLARGKNALVLVPEISLTPQLAARFRARFGNQVAVLHSGLTDAERYSQWRLISGSQLRIVVGARSAVFAPLAQLGAVIVDEEHDPSFKQEEGLHYHARDVALVRAKMAGAIALLGSATPSLESYHGVEQGRLQLLCLPQRATPRPLPEVQIVDLRRYQTDAAGVLSAPLAAALQETWERGEQTILFLNRRGFSSVVLCRSCGEAVRCQHCSVSLTYHRSLGRLICHYCGFGKPVPQSCPACGAEAVELLGLGTEKVEQVLEQRFPGLRVARLDRDTAAGKGLRNILAQVGRREVDVLVGTQMVTKGHDFPHVTLVGVISADQGLHFPDFRAAERTFQLLTQVAGRAGRGQAAGRVVIQTYNPEHCSLLAAKEHDYQAFYKREIQARQELAYPPFSYLAAIRLDGEDARAVVQRAEQLAQLGQRLCRKHAGVQLLGPAEAPIQRLKDRTRWLLLLRAAARPPLRQLLEELLQEQDASPSRVRVTVDIDPLFML